MKIPFLDLYHQHQPLKEEIQQAITAVIEQSAFAGGPFVEAFETHFAQFCQQPFAIGVNSGTTALWLALLGLDIGAGDEVITTPNTFIATAEAISYCGAHPVFVDIHETTYNMDVRALEAAITPKTRAIIPVHLFGQMADMDPIMEIAKRHDLKVIEDASQAHGAQYHDKPAGAIGDAGCFSLYPGKNLGAFGEAGVIVTRHAKLARKLRILRDHGQPRKYHHVDIGWNGRMDGIQGAILNIKLRHLSQWNEDRRKCAQLYQHLLDSLSTIQLPQEADFAKHVYHVYSIRTSARDRLMQALADRGIACGIHYPVPIHLQSAYDFLKLPRGSFPAAEKCADEILSLPIYPTLQSAQIEYIAAQIQAFFARETF